MHWEHPPNISLPLVRLIRKSVRHPSDFGAVLWISQWRIYKPSVVIEWTSGLDRCVSLLAHHSWALLVRQVTLSHQECTLVRCNSIIFRRCRKQLLSRHPSIFLLLLEWLEGLSACILSLLALQILVAVHHAPHILFSRKLLSPAHSIRVALICLLPHTFNALVHLKGLDIAIVCHSFFGHLIAKTVSFFYHESLPIQITVFILSVAQHLLSVLLESCTFHVDYGELLERACLISLITLAMLLWLFHSHCSLIFSTIDLYI